MNNKLQLRVTDIVGSICPLSSDSAQKLICKFSNTTSLELDFSGVEEMGDDFAREIFVIWRERNPKSTISVIGASKEAENVIFRVMKSRE